MSNDYLPDDIKGSWIWKNGNQDDIESYVFFRSEFTLDEIPSMAEFWIAASSNFKVYINGRHVCRGPLSSAKHTINVAAYEIAYCLQVGRNLITIVGHNTKLSRFCNVSKTAGLWCQVNVEGEPTIWTDQNWMAHKAECYSSQQPRISNSDSFVETMDFRQYPTTWFLEDFEFDDSWEPAYETGKFNRSLKIISSPPYEISSVVDSFFTLRYHGVGELAKASAQVAYDNAANHPGVYAATTFLHSQEEYRKTDFYIYSDDPYYLYVNHKLIKYQGGNPALNWTDPNWETPRTYAQDEMVDPHGRMTVHAGINRITIVQQASNNSAGASIIFRDVKHTEFKFTRSKDAISMPGWNVVGPLITPFTHVTEPRNLEKLDNTPYYARNPNDIAALLTAYKFETKEESEFELDAFELDKGQYVVLQMDRFKRGCLELNLSGDSGDIVDILYSGGLDGQHIKPLANDTRKIYSITLNQGTNLWSAVAPHTSPVISHKVGCPITFTYRISKIEQEVLKVWIVILFIKV